MSRHCISCNLARIKKQFEAKMEKELQEKSAPNAEIKRVEPIPELIAAAIRDAMGEQAPIKKSRKKRDNIEEQKGLDGIEELGQNPQ